ncbi:MAG: hypothetical protein ABI647_03075 [Gemmatimonadota bacterium]
MRVRVLLFGVALGACSKSVQQVNSTAAPMASSSMAAPIAVAQAFMQAAADSNLAQMGHLWGTDRGPAATTGIPSDWERRVVVMYSYLRGGSSRIRDDGTMASGNRRHLLIELSRGGCVKQVPITMVRTSDGAWLVNAVDLNAAGNPNKPCDSGSPSSKPPELLGSALGIIRSAR